MGLSEIGLWVLVGILLVAEARRVVNYILWRLTHRVENVHTVCYELDRNEAPRSKAKPAEPSTENHTAEPKTGEGRPLTADQGGKK